MITVRFEYNARSLRASQTLRIGVVPASASSLRSAALRAKPKSEKIATPIQRNGVMRSDNTTRGRKVGARPAHFWPRSPLLRKARRGLYARPRPIATCENSVVITDAIQGFTRSVWLKGGLYNAATATLLAVFMELLNRGVWWYQETIWFRALVYLNYPARELTTLVLNNLEVPRLYDVPLTWREAIIINLTGWSFGIIWWFLLAAAASVVWLRLKRPARS